MAGSLGLGVGVIAGTSLVTPDTGDLLVKYWLRDSMAIMPRLQLTLDKMKDVNATWVIAPQVMALFVPWKTRSTRLNIGAGLGLAFAKFSPTQTHTTIDIFLPVHLGVEHFFTRWFSMGIAIETRLLDYAKEGDLWNLHVGLQTSGNNTYAYYPLTSAGAATLPAGWSVTTALASLMFYTD
jgi:hypothetical protein